MENKMLSVKDINLLQAQNEGLKKQNKELQHYLACMTEQRNKANTCLQEIKDIIHEQLMWQGQLPQCELEILQKITKEEEEWK